MEEFKPFLDLYSEVPFKDWSKVPRFARSQGLWNDKNACTWTCEWPSTDMPDEVRTWFRDRGWLASVVPAAVPNTAVFAPVVYVPTPAICFHTTKASLLPLILEQGLRPACNSGHSTTKRPDCRHFIHVTGELKDAKNWMKDDLLGKGNPGESWVILSLDLRDAGIRLFRDPASRTGFITDADRIDRRFVTDSVQLDVEFALLDQSTAGPR